MTDLWEEDLRLQESGERQVLTEERSVHEGTGRAPWVMLKEAHPARHTAPRLPLHLHALSRDLALPVLLLSVLLFGFLRSEKRLLLNSKKPVQASLVPNC